MKIPHYLNNSRLFSRLTRRGDRMHYDGLTTWSMCGRRRNDRLGPDTPNRALHHHPTSRLSQQQQIHHHQQIRPRQQRVPHRHKEATNELMMAPDPLRWEFPPYERSIVGQPPLAIVGASWKWDMEVHDHWKRLTKASWSLVNNATSNAGNGSAHDKSDPSSPPSVSTASSNALPRWLSLEDSKLKGTPTEPGVYPITIEATFQEDNDPEPIAVRGNYTIQVFRALPQDEENDLPEEDQVVAPAMIYGHESNVGERFGDIYERGG
jgi:hypothetical protein